MHHETAKKASKKFDLESLLQKEKNEAKEFQKRHSLVDISEMSQTEDPESEDYVLSDEDEDHKEKTSSMSFRIEMIEELNKLKIVNQFSNLTIQTG
jgi:hypothetical protein